MKKIRYIIPLLLSSQLALFGAISYAAEPNWYAKGLKEEYAGNYQSAIENYTKSANYGLSDASFAIGRIYKNIGDDTSSFDWFIKAANARNKFAQYEIGLIYLNGSSATAVDRKEALKWFSISANSGLGEASFELFKLVKEIKWLTSAAEQGVSGAIEHLSEAYEKGLYGLEIDVNESKIWAQRFIDSQEQGEFQ